MEKPKEHKEPTLSFSTEEYRQQCIADFNNLEQHRGWKLISEYLNKKIKFHEDQLFDGDIKTIEEAQLIRAKRNICLQLINLPEIIRTQLTMSQEPEVDPFE